MLQLVDHGTHVGQDDDDDEDDDRHPQQQHHAEVEDHGEYDHRQYRATCQQELSSAQTPPFVLTKGVNEIHNIRRVGHTELSFPDDTYYLPRAV